MTNKQIPVWIDCDTGTDDSVAIMLAHALPELSVIGLSAVAGNSPLYNTFPNTRRVVHLLGADYPVYPGAERPLMREPHVAGKFHGENGLGDVELPLPDTAPESTFAWDALYATAKRMPGELRLVATGPLTNVAIALTKYPELKQLLHSIALMGGAAVGGNVTPAAEFNIYADPEAAKIVFDSGIPLIMCGLDATLKCNLTRNQIMKLCQSGDPAARACGDMAGYVLENFSKYRCVASIHAAVPFMYLIHPEFFKTEKVFLDVDCSDGAGRGATLCDFRWWLHEEDEMKDMILTDADTESFQQELFEAIYSVSECKNMK